MVCENTSIDALNKEKEKKDNEKKKHNPYKLNKVISFPLALLN